MVARLSYKQEITMNKILSVVMLLTISTILYAQKDVTRFLGIPVDGSKSEMIQKLKAKGYRYNSTLDRLEGEFNGSQVYLSVVTNNNKVWRIVVIDAVPSNEADIRIRFNALCRQFKKNQRYIPVSSSSDYYLSEDEDISYEMTVKNKRYEAIYNQIPTVTEPINKVLPDMLKQKLDNEELLNLKKYILSKYTAELIADNTKWEQIIYESLEAIYKNSVWFMIDQQYGEYRIVMFYDNEHNRSNGEDL